MSSSEGVLNYFDVRDQCIELYKSLDGLSDWEKATHSELIRLSSQRVKCQYCDEVIVYSEAAGHNVDKHYVIYVADIFS